MHPARRVRHPAEHIRAPFLPSESIDEIGYLPIDKVGANLLFQVISQHYEQGSILLTTNQPYKPWPKISNNDSTLTSAVLDRTPASCRNRDHRWEDYRMKDQIETP